MQGIGCVSLLKLEMTLFRLEYPTIEFAIFGYREHRPHGMECCWDVVVFDKLLIKFGYFVWCMTMGLENLVTWCVRQWCKLRCNLLLCCFSKFCCWPIHKTCKPRKRWSLLHVEDNVTWPMESVGRGNGPP